MKYSVVDIDNWKRKNLFNYLQTIPTRCTLGFRIDITRFKQVLKDNNLKFCVTLIFGLSKVMNSNDAYRYGYLNDELVLYDEVNPFYTVFHEDDESFSYIWTEYSKNYDTFAENYFDDMAKYKDCKNICAKPDLPKNSFFISIVPWASFTSITTSTQGFEYHMIPQFYISKFYEESGKLYLPVNIVANHSTCDGFHLSLFAKKLQDFVDDFTPEMYM